MTNALKNSIIITIINLLHVDKGKQSAVKNSKL